MHGFGLLRNVLHSRGQRKVQLRVVVGPLQQSSGALSARGVLKPIDCDGAAANGKTLYAIGSGEWDAHHCYRVVVGSIIESVYMGTGFGWNIDSCQYSNYVGDKHYINGRFGADAKMYEYECSQHGWSFCSSTTIGEQEYGEGSSNGGCPEVWLGGETYSKRKRHTKLVLDVLASPQGFLSIDVDEPQKCYYVTTISGGIEDFGLDACASPAPTPAPVPTPAPAPTTGPAVPCSYKGMSFIDYSNPGYGGYLCAPVSDWDYGYGDVWTARECADSCAADPRCTSAEWADNCGSESGSVSANCPPADTGDVGDRTYCKRCTTLQTASTIRKVTETGNLGWPHHVLVCTAPQAFVVSGGMCYSAALRNVEYVEAGYYPRTTEGAPYYRDASSSYYIYWAPDCDSGRGLWVVSDKNPYHHMDCGFARSLSEPEISPPPGKTTWRVFCFQEWTGGMASWNDNDLTLTQVR